MSPLSLRLQTLLALSASTAALLVAAPALAQTAADAPATAAPAPAAQSDDETSTLEELVVTAEKREQSLNDVPVAVSAFTSSQRDVVGITGIQDFVNFTPGMNYSGTDRISLRGSGRNTFYTGNDPGVATYTDGFYSASSSELFKSPLFVERTEILRGPQGTLYGRNAMGGAVNTISKRPADTFSGEIRGAVANYDYTRVEGVVSIPLAEHLRTKIGGSQEWQRKGFIENVGPGNDQGAIKRTYFEFQVEGELGEKTTAWLRYNRTSWDDTTGVGDRMANLISPYDVTGLMPFNTPLVTNPALGYTTANPAVNDPYKINTNRNGYGALRGNHLLTAQVTYDLGWADLKYIGGFQQYNYQTGGDYDYTSRTAPVTLPGALLPTYLDYTTDFNEYKKYFSNEINLTSKGDGQLQWILGLYQYHENYRQRIQNGDPQQTQLERPCYYIGAPLYCAPAPLNPDRDFVDLNARLKSNAWAVFGQATYKFNDVWSLTGGLRYTQDKKAGYESSRLVLYSPVGPFGPVLGSAYAFDVSTDLDPATPGVQNARALNGTWDAVTGTLNLNWQPDRDTLAYAKYSRGYKSGGFLLGSLAPTPEADQESVNAYELGFKKTFFRQLQTNASVFYNDYKDLQLNLSQLNANGTATASNFINVDARAYGLELETLWQPVRALQVSLNYSYLNTEITKGCCFYDPADPSARLPGARPTNQTLVNRGVLLVLQDLKGAPLFQSPENKVAANVNYTFDFTPGSLTLSGSYVWTDETAYQPFNDPAVRVPAYDTADFRAIWKDAENRYSVIAYVKNAFDEQGFNSVGSTYPYAEFGNPNPGLVVNGVTYAGQTGTTITRGLIAPRTYGLELQYRF